MIYNYFRQINHHADEQWLTVSTFDEDPSEKICYIEPIK